MKTKHSPAPFRLIEATEKHGHILQDKLGDSIAALAWKNGDNPPEEQLANARLFCAAPELLEALKAMCGMYEKFMEKANHGASAYDAETIRALNEIPIQAQAAIARATDEPK